jgi:hypothetical protein
MFVLLRTRLGRFCLKSKCPINWLILVLGSRPCMDERFSQFIRKIAPLDIGPVWHGEHQPRVAYPRTQLGRRFSAFPSRSIKFCFFCCRRWPDARLTRSVWRDYFRLPRLILATAVPNRPISTLQLISAYSLSQNTTE